eukprot:TRINITY_DN808_c0_g1_i3.p1 TRINITY_DN808_c0_g1~~TRINITY_DN808_c0_g1_i3.p1  ORF type:complete len:158 (+),score=26.66 TRINITY_DN808_c0_g1_i3:148-621(+)
MRPEFVKFLVPASIASAGLYSLVLSHCWYGVCDDSRDKENQTEEESTDGLHLEVKRNEPIVTIACGLLEAMCLHYLGQAIPGRKEGPATVWLEVSVLGTLLLLSSRLMQYSISVLRPLGGLQLQHVGFDIARVAGSSALVVGVEQLLSDQLEESSLP